MPNGGAYYSRKDDHMFGLFSAPSVEKRLATELEAARHALLDAESAMERARHNLALYRERVKRLEDQSSAKDAA